MTQSLNPRIEWDVREAIEEIAQADWTISDTAAKLIEVGIAIRELGYEPQIEGPLGLPRPFAEISLSSRMDEIRTEIDDTVAERLTDEFANKPNTAAREALRLGVLTVAQDQFKIQGPAGEPRPFAQISIEHIDDADTRDLIVELQQRL